MRITVTSSVFSAWFSSNRSIEYGAIGDICSFFATILALLSNFVLTITDAPDTSSKLDAARNISI